jgi:hypothetical protein
MVLACAQNKFYYRCKSLHEQSIHLHKKTCYQGDILYFYQLILLKFGIRFLIAIHVWKNSENIWC